MVRVALFAAVLAVAAVCVTRAAWLVDGALGWAVAGVTLAVWGWLVLGELPPTTRRAPAGASDGADL